MDFVVIVPCLHAERNQETSSKPTEAAVMRLEQQIRALRVTTDLPGAHDVEAMANRVERLELLYQAARRDDPQSGTHGLYTGLHQESPV